MLMPSIFGENFVDDFLGYPSRVFDNKHFGYMDNHDLMKTDIKEADDRFELDINLPGFKKEDISAELKSGYLTISASTKKDSEQKDETSGKYIRKERYEGSCSRSFYVGEDVTKEDIKAKYENGILSLVVPKVDKKPKVEEKNYIAIEG